MLRLLADADLDDRLSRGVRAKAPDIDLVLSREADINNWSDSQVLEWAANEDRIVLSHDRNTMTRFIKSRIALNLPTTGLIIVDRTMAIGQAIEETLIVAVCGHPDEWPDRTLYLPL